MPTSFDRFDRCAVARGDASGVDRHVVGGDAGALDLQVAADARPEVGDAVAVFQRRLRRRGGAGRAAEDRDQVLVVGAVILVLVGDRARFAPVVDDLVLRAGGIVRRRFAGFLLGVEPGHDHDAVVVARSGDRFLDRAVGAFGAEQLVGLDQRRRFLAGDRFAGLARPQQDSRSSWLSLTDLCRRFIESFWQTRSARQSGLPPGHA